MSASGTKRGRDGTRALAAVRSLVVLGTLALAERRSSRDLARPRGGAGAPVLALRQEAPTTPIPQSVERDIVRALGAVYGPYTGTCFASTRQTDIEHIVAASEAHDSGLCARGPR